MARPSRPHAPKLAAYIARFLDATGGETADGGNWRRLMLAWNGLEAGADGTLPPLPDARLWTERTARWRAALLGQPHLVERLVAFAASRGNRPAD